LNEREKERNREKKFTEIGREGREKEEGERGRGRESRREGEKGEREGQRERDRRYGTGAAQRSHKIKNSLRTFIKKSRR
jgi:hypothetical protein